VVPAIDAEALISFEGLLRSPHKQPAQEEGQFLSDHSFHVNEARPPVATFKKHELFFNRVIHFRKDGERLGVKVTGHNDAATPS